MKPLISLLFAAALAGSLVAGCSKSSDSSSSGSAASAPPVTDPASSGVKGGDAAATTGDAAHGKEIFSQNCSSCHGADGAGGNGMIGPSLKGEKARKDLAATIAWIKNPVAPMPKLYPSPLAEQDVADVAAYVQSL